MTEKFKESFFTIIGPALVAVIGWFMMSTLKDIQGDVKLLLEGRATMKEQIIHMQIELDRLNKEHEKTNLGKVSHNMFIYDKTKQLVYTPRGFKYV